jgi:hypothetical protein
MLTLLLLLCLDPNFKEEVLSMDVSKLGHSVYHDGQILLSYFPQKSIGFHTMLIDLRNQTVRSIKDPRIRVFAPYGIPTANGFALLTRAKALGSIVYFLDKTGNYAGQDGLTHFDGWDKGLKVSTLANDDLGTALLTLRNGGSLVLARVDFEARQINYLLNQQVEEEYQYSFFRESDTYFRVCYQTGAIQSFSSERPGSGTLLRGAREPVYPPRDKKWAKVTGKPINLLEQPIATHDGWVIHWRQFYDGGGHKLKQVMPRHLQLNDGQLIEGQQASLGSYDSRTILYDWSERHLIIH